MTQSQDELTSFRVSTFAFPERDASELLRVGMGRVLMRVLMEPLVGGRLQADNMCYAAANFGMTGGMLSAMHTFRPPSLIADNDLVLVFMRDGEGLLNQHAAQTDVREGQAVLTDNAAAASFTFHKQFSPICLRFNRSILEPHLHNLDDFLRAPVLGDSPALRLLESYALEFSETAASATPETRQTAIKHLYDLVALAIGARCDSAEMAANRGLRAARLHSVKKDIVRSLHDPHLSPNTIAARNGISPRYMRMLFEREGTSFSEFVLLKRLQLSHYMLSQMQYFDRPISSIAFDCGFGDLSHFNQAFRRHYGQTPSEVRASAHSMER